MSSTTLFILTSDIKNLFDVKEKILIIQKREEIRHVDEETLKTLQGDDDVFISKWQPYEEYENVCHLRLPDNSEVSFLVKEAYIETSKREKNMYNNKKLLPKSERTIFENIKTVFFEKSGRVYLLLFTTYQTSINKVKQKLLCDEAYIETDNIGYNIPGDLFYWLFYKYKEKNKFLAERFEVEAISGFLGNIADEHNTIKGESEVTPNLLVTKAFVSKFYPIRSLNIILKLDDYSLNFILNDISQCSISTSSIIPGDVKEIDISSAIIIYSYIIPELLRLFSSDVEWSQEKKKSFTKSIGEEVIKEIAVFHGIDLKSL
ncbi:hypothetical protein [Clostridium sp. JS66]|uniref:hypothetical protein n=1 Tax=Clostridium sp. JS66 TaxID=3064705 RepID=UPI00298E879C|nr:hypothetical protein [Clostridium sp. JS66]WPC40937.1 hypothetical protein Q6H37_24060 [Clostridium sp. JS66]